MTSIVHIYRRFPTPESCIAHLEQVRWGDAPECPYCRSPRVGRKNDGGQRWNCHLCRKSFSVTVGTIFHNSHIDLQRWFLLIALMFSAKKGLSAMQAARDLEMRRPTVWSMMHRVRAAMKDDGELLKGIVEMDETYVGGKPRRFAKKDDDDNTPSLRGRGTKKTPVVGAVERGGRVKAKPVDKEEGELMYDADSGEVIEGQAEQTVTTSKGKLDNFAAEEKVEAQPTVEMPAEPPTIKVPTFPDDPQTADWETFAQSMLATIERAPDRAWLVKFINNHSGPLMNLGKLKPELLSQIKSALLS